MKYLFPCFLALPLLASCVEQDSYSERNYYAPPPPRVEIERHDLNRHHHHRNGYYRPVPQVRASHGHNNVHGGSNIIVNPHPPQGQVQVQQPKSSQNRRDKGSHIKNIDNRQ